MAKGGAEKTVQKQDVISSAGPVFSLRTHGCMALPAVAA